MTERPDPELDRLLAENDAAVGDWIDAEFDSEPTDSDEVDSSETVDPELDAAADDERAGGTIDDRLEQDEPDEPV